MLRKTILPIGLTIVLSIALAAGLAYLNRWYLAIFSLYPFVTAFVGLLLALIGLVMRRAQTGSAGRLRPISRVLLLLGLAGILQLTAPPQARFFRDREVQRAQTFLESLVPVLEDYKLRNAGYPEHLSLVLAPGTPLPALLQLRSEAFPPYDNRDFYQPRAETYVFTFYVPDGFIGFQYQYCCGPEGTWTVTD
jgi:hypothetical protein